MRRAAKRLPSLPVALWAALLAAGPAAAEDQDALAVADQAQQAARPASDWRGFAEAALGQSQRRGDGGAAFERRLSLGVDLDKRIAPGWRAVLSDRYDFSRPHQPARPDGINTLKEAYLGWQVRDDLIVDAGRINARYGVAFGYNPTDYLRDGALRSVVSSDPRSLKENRLGSVMLRGQWLWKDTSLALLWSPKLREERSDASFSPDFGATNNSDRALVVFSHKVGGLMPQWLIHVQQGQAPQLGLNLSMLASDSTVAYLEWSGGRGASQLEQALGLPGGRVFRQRAAAGFTYSTPFKLSLTAEYQHDGAAPVAAEWDALRRGPAPAYVRYRAWQDERREPATRHGLFLHAAWQDVLLNRLDLNAMLNRSLVDGSHMTWLEMRYRLTHADVGLQWQVNCGDAGTEFGAAPQRRIWQAVLRFYY
jgi:hypothetical protein